MIIHNQFTIKLNHYSLNLLNCFQLLEIIFETLNFYEHSVIQSITYHRFD